MERGTSATGMAWLNGTKIRIRKGEGSAADFIAKQPKGIFEEAAASPRGLLHARATTKGSEKDNANNHPVFGLGWLVVHNGTVTNDDDLWGFYTKKEQLKRFAEVDTSAVSLVLSRGTDMKSSIQQLSLLGGSATIAAWRAQQSDQIVLARFGHNDLLLFLDESARILYWSSAGAAAYLMPGRTMGRHKFLTMSKLSDEYAMLLSPAGIEQVQTFKVTRSPFVWRRRGVTTPPNTVITPSMGPGGHGPSPKTALPVKASGGLRGDNIQVTFANPTAVVLAAKVVWAANPINNVPTVRPKPLYEAIQPEWHSLLRCRHTLERFWRDAEASSESIYEFSTGYGRWVFTLPGYRPGEVLDINAVTNTRVFKPYKRTKDWHHRAYRLKCDLPASFETVTVENGRTRMVTLYDEHLAWEHYHIERELKTGTTTYSNGFMCPWCGVARSAVDVEHNRGMCEFCNIISELPAEGHYKEVD